MSTVTGMEPIMAFTVLLAARTTPHVPAAREAELAGGSWSVLSFLHTKSVESIRAS